ncbi:rhodanese-like domain-containing protein [Prochlorothrix hollandica]|uniref:rhodanese-like domain-containing protein n=1 Tax=Prochlorothrix hollandica TaxID=1223 RepID=UPI000348A81A|nr:rhodanese family protein [Prochlorothrix hollandica]
MNSTTTVPSVNSNSETAIAQPLIPSPTGVPGLQTVDPASLHQHLSQGTVVLVDVREPGEHRGENIPQACCCPLSSLEPSQLPPVADHQTLVLHCQSGMRSTKAAEKLLAAGYSSVIHLEGGLNGWKAAGLPTQVDATAPISMMRQVQIVAGSLVVTGTLLGTFVAPGFLILSGFVGAGLVFAGVSNTCAMAALLSKLPYNRAA